MTALSTARLGVAAIVLAALAALAAVTVGSPERSNAVATVDCSNPVGAVFRQLADGNRTRECS